MQWPRIVAHALRESASPPPAVGAIGERAAIVPSAAVACDDPPAFLLEHQHDSWRRIVAALRGWNGAILAEPVGTGKTWIALAICNTCSGAAHVIVPAILRAHWLRCAAAAHVNITVSTHERLSRGHTPSGDPALVIVDEAHRFREPGIRRTRTLAPWLVGRRVLLVTATPIVNRIGDLLTLLRLVLSDDALALDGIPHLAQLAGFPAPPLALRRVVLRTPRSVALHARRRTCRFEAGAEEAERGVRAVAVIRGLELSRVDAVRRLVASVLCDAAASSDHAFVAVLRRYRALLHHAAASGGVSRDMIRRFTGPALDQVTLWPLVAGDVQSADLPNEDAARIDAALQQFPAHDRWTETLRLQCVDEIPSVCFTRHRATARLLTERMGEDVAWVTGKGAGIGPHRLDRDLVLDAFGRDRSAWRTLRRPPRILVATDVAAEGLDLQSAGRIVHVDLPWTAVRVDQREGRLLRLGQRHDTVDVIVRSAPPALEDELALIARVARKRDIAATWLDGAGESSPPRSDTSSARDTRPVLIAAHAGSRCGVLQVVPAASGWHVMPVESPRIFAEYARGCGTMTPVAAAAALRAAAASLAENAPVVPADLVVRIHDLARAAARQRDGAALSRLDRLLRFVTAPTTIGAAIRLAQLEQLSDRDLSLAMVPDMPPAPFPVLMLLDAGDPAIATIAAELRCNDAAL